MNQEKIGAFIAERRKYKKLTQAQLGVKLGVSDRSVSKWETGKCMPDLSLFEPLCRELDIKVNELLSGELVSRNHYQEKLEENILNTIDYTSKKIMSKNTTLGIILLFFGFFIMLTASSIFPSVSSWCALYSILGSIVSLIGFSRFTIRLNYLKRVILNFSFYMCLLCSLFFLDFANVAINKQAPRFTYISETVDTNVLYHTPFYNVFKINKDSINEYSMIDYKKEYTMDTIPLSPFNRDKSGIDNLTKYQNKYIGNNSNNGNLLEHLPLSEYGYVFRIDTKELGLIVDYHTTDWYNTDSHYVQSALIYNSVSLFTLIENVQYITYNFSGSSYTITRIDIENNYPDFSQLIIDEKINRDNFNQYVENRMNDEAFIEMMFELLF